MNIQCLNVHGAVSCDKLEQPRDEEQPCCCESQKGSKSTNDWQLETCCFYLFEFVSGFCLSEMHNVLKSLGFESIAPTYDK